MVFQSREEIVYSQVNAHYNSPRSEERQSGVCSRFLHCAGGGPGPWSLFKGFLWHRPFFAGCRTRKTIRRSVIHCKGRLATSCADRKWPGGRTCQQAICGVVRLGLGIAKTYALRLASGLLVGLRCSQKAFEQALKHSWSCSRQVTCQPQFSLSPFIVRAVAIAAPAWSLAR